PPRAYPRISGTPCTPALPRRMTGELVHESIAVTTNGLPVGFVATHDTVGATVSTTVTVVIRDGVVARRVSRRPRDDRRCDKELRRRVVRERHRPAQSSVAIGSPSGGEMQSFRSR